MTNNNDTNAAYIESLKKTFALLQYIEYGEEPLRHSQSRTSPQAPNTSNDPADTPTSTTPLDLRTIPNRGRSAEPGEPPHVKLLVNDAEALYEFLQAQFEALEGNSLLAERAKGAFLALSCRLYQQRRRKR